MVYVVHRYWLNFSCLTDNSEAFAFRRCRPHKALEIYHNRLIYRRFNRISSFKNSFNHCQEFRNSTRIQTDLNLQFLSRNMNDLGAFQSLNDSNSGSGNGGAMLVAVSSGKVTCDLNNLMDIVDMDCKF